MPDYSTVHTDSALSNFAVRYDTQNYIADRVFPPIGVRKQSDIFYKFDIKRESLRPQDDFRAPGTEAKTADYKMTTDSYYCDGHALADVVADELIENADAPIAPEMDTVEFLQEKVMTIKEVDAKAKLDSASLTSRTLSSGNRWSDYESSDPIDDMRKGQIIVRNAIGKIPNIAVMDWEVYAVLRQHPTIVDAVVGGSTSGDPATVSDQDLARVLRLDELIIADAQKNGAAQNATASLSNVWGTDVYLAYRAPRPSIKNVSLGYTFQWNAFSGGQMGWMVQRERDNKKHGWWLEVSRYYSQKVVLAGCGYKIASAIDAYTG